MDFNHLPQNLVNNRMFSSIPDELPITDGAFSNMSYHSWPHSMADATLAKVIAYYTSPDIALNLRETVYEKRPKETIKSELLKAKQDLEQLNIRTFECKKADHHTAEKGVHTKEDLETCLKKEVNRIQSNITRLTKEYLLRKLPEVLKRMHHEIHVERRDKEILRQQNQNLLQEVHRLQGLLEERENGPMDTPGSTFEQPHSMHDATMSPMGASQSSTGYLSCHETTCGSMDQSYSGSFAATPSEVSFPDSNSSLDSEMAELLELVEQSGGWEQYLTPMPIDQQ